MVMKMTQAQATRYLVGRTIARVEMRPFSDGRGGVTFDPLLVLDDGSAIYFMADETESSRYGVTAYRMVAQDRSR